MINTKYIFIYNFNISLSTNLTGKIHSFIVSS